MAKTLYSHAFLTGSFNSRIQPERLDGNEWNRILLSAEEYGSRCGYFYKSHVDAMAEMNPAAGGQVSQERPKFLRDVCHYVCESGASLVLGNYAFRLERLHIYFFPLNLSFFVLEIDDTGTELNDLTQGHYWLMGLSDKMPAAGKEALNRALLPLMKAAGVTDCSDLIQNGNKLKLFQVVRTGPLGIGDSERDDLLYEVATSSAIGIVNAGNHMSPSRDYVKRVLGSNLISVFGEWRALALVDTFTVLSLEAGFDPWTFNNLYFPYIYLRCLFEKTFCFSRNDFYRLNRRGYNLANEMVLMEKYYFYSHISFNFLPNLILEAIARGMDIRAEREELSKQIKEKATRNRAFVMAFISAFTVFSVAGTVSKLLIGFGADPGIELTFNCVAILAWFVYLYYLWQNRKV